jgi:hypothetical protein
MLALAALAAAAGLPVLLLSARGPDARSRFDRLSPDEVLVRVQRAMAQKGSYRIEVQGQNLVLPRWGGVDSGTVDVRLDGSSASAALERTGDGPYKIMLADGQTYFQRSTCPSFTRVPGGGPEVLTPFVLSDLVDPRHFFPVGGVDRGPVIEARTPELGRVAFELDPESFLPFRLWKIRTQADGGSNSEWEFSNWGEPVNVDAPSGDIADNGPGGNPC